MREENEARLQCCSRPKRSHTLHAVLSLQRLAEWFLHSVHADWIYYSVVSQVPERMIMVDYSHVLA